MGGTSGRLVAPTRRTRLSALLGSHPSICTSISVFSRRLASCSPAAMCLQASTALLFIQALNLCVQALIGLFIQSFINLASCVCLCGCSFAQLFCCSFVICWLIHSFVKFHSCVCVLVRLLGCSTAWASTHPLHEMVDCLLVGWLHD